jgi:hypothetical protein
MRIIRQFVLVLVIATPLSGCGIFGQCPGKPCPAGFERDAFCGCMKSASKEPGGGSQPAVPTALSPQWICPAEGSATEAESWEPDRGFGSDMTALRGKTVPFVQPSCDLTAIPFLRQVAKCELDSKGDPLCITPGTRSVMNVRTVTRHTNLLNGAVAWGVRGTITERRANDEVSATGTPPSGDDDAPFGIGKLLTQMHGALAINYSLAKDFYKSSLSDVGGVTKVAPLACEVHCRQQDEFCALSTVNRVDLERWRNLLARISSKPPTIKKSEFMAAASSNNDACKRSDLTLKLDGRFENLGETCKMDPIAFEGGSAVVSIPGRLAGQLSLSSDGTIAVTFSSTLESLSVDFTNKDDHDEFGGTITAMSLAPRSLTVATSSGKCIQLHR